LDKKSKIGKKNKKYAKKIKNRLKKSKISHKIKNWPKKSKIRQKKPKIASDSQIFKQGKNCGKALFLAEQTRVNTTISP